MCADSFRLITVLMILKFTTCTECALKVGIFNWSYRVEGAAKMFPLYSVLLHAILCLILVLIMRMRQPAEGSVSDYVYVHSVVGLRQ